MQYLPDDDLRLFQLRRPADLVRPLPRTGGGPIVSDYGLGLPQRGPTRSMSVLTATGNASRAQPSAIRSCRRSSRGGRFYRTAALQRHHQDRGPPLGRRICALPEQLAAYTGPGVAVQWVEIEGPLVEPWPPRAHTRLSRRRRPRESARWPTRKSRCAGFAAARLSPAGHGRGSGALSRAREGAARWRATVRAGAARGLKGVLFSPDFLFFQRARRPAR